MITKMKVIITENDKKKTFDFNYEEINNNPYHSNRMQELIRFIMNKRTHFPIMEVDEKPKNPRLFLDENI